MPPTPDHRPPDRRKFLRTAAAGAALSLSAKSYAAGPGASERVRIGVLGCGGRAQAHLNLITSKLAQDAAAVAVCDVWDGLDEEFDQNAGGHTTRRRYAQGLYPSAVKCGLDP